MRYNPVYAAFEKIQAMNNLKNYQRLLRDECSKTNPSFEMAQYYRQRVNKCRQILGGQQQSKKTH